MVLVRRSGELVLCVVAEYWNQIGGRSATYHDSYTYSVFAGQPTSEALRRFLSLQPDADRWRVIPARA